MKKLAITAIFSLIVATAIGHAEPAPASGAADMGPPPGASSAMDRSPAQNDPTTVLTDPGSLVSALTVSEPAPFWPGVPRESVVVRDGGVVAKPDCPAGTKPGIAMVPEGRAVGNGAAWVVHAIGLHVAAKVHGGDAIAYTGCVGAPRIYHVEVSARSGGEVSILSFSAQDRVPAKARNVIEMTCLDSVAVPGAQKSSLAHRNIEPVGFGAQVTPLWHGGAISVRISALKTSLKSVSTDGCPVVSTIRLETSQDVRPGEDTPLLSTGDAGRETTFTIKVTPAY